jgi:hypothetical protein
MGTRPSPRRTDKDCNAGQRLATHVLAIGARSAVSVRRFTASLPPNRCAAHREPLSSVYVYIRRRGDCVVVYIRGHETALMSTYGGGWRGATHVLAIGRRPSPRRTDKDCNAGQRLATHVLAIGARSAVSVRRFTASLPPNRCAAHREPLSSVYVYIRSRATALLSTCGGVGLRGCLRVEGRGGVRCGGSAA